MPTVIEMCKFTFEECNGRKSGKCKRDHMPTIAKPIEMCHYVQDECNWFKENKCKKDHKVDE